MALTPPSRFKEISRIKNKKNHCVIAKSSPVKTLLLGDFVIAGLKRYDNVWKKYFSNTLNFGTGGEGAENAFLRAINMTEMPYLQHVVILSGTNNIKKNSPFNIAECHIEIGKHFQERSLNVSVIISGILP